MMRRGRQNQQGIAALLVTVIVLVTLGLIAAVIFFQSRSGLKISGQDKRHREHLNVATEQNNRVADWLKVWFQNSATSPLDPLVFVKNPNPGGKPEYQMGGLFHHIDLDYSQA